MESNRFICTSTDEDYIDMEVNTSSSSSSSNLFYGSSPQHQTREFEFQKMASVFHDKSQIFSSPADELFYKGKLLPLHLPRRIQMVRNLIQDSNSTIIAGDNNKTDFSVTESGTVSNCIFQVNHVEFSSELNPDEHLVNWSSELTRFMADNPKHSWSKKLKLIKIKDSSLGQKLKTFSWSYLKSFFNKSSRSNSNESCAKPASCIMESISESTPNEKYHLSDFVFKSMDHDQNDGLNKNIIQHRKSFSGAIKRRSVTKGISSTSSSGSSSSSSSSFSFSLNGCYDLQLLKRSISANSDIEKSIEGAIAHCKKSQELLISKITTMNEEVSPCSVSASRTATCCDTTNLQRLMIKQIHVIFFNDSYHQ